MTFFYFCVMVTVMFEELLGMGFGSVELFFVFRGLVLSILMVVFVAISIFMGYLSAPPDIIYYTRIACICQHFFKKKFCTKKAGDCSPALLLLLLVSLLC